MTEVKEARVTSQVNRYWVADLRLELIKGVPQTLSERQVQGSIDLQGAVRGQAVSLEWVTRAREERPPSSPAPEAAILRPVRIHNPPPQTPPEPAPPQEAGITRTEVTALLNDFMVELRGMIQGATLQTAAPPAPPQHPSPAPVVVSIRDDEWAGADQGADPVFIPSRIVTNEGSSVETQTETSDAPSNLAQAEAALSLLRRGKRKSDVED